MNRFNYILAVLSFFILGLCNIYADSLSLLVTSNVNGEIDPCG